MVENQRFHQSSIGRYHTGKSCFGVVFYLLFIVEKMHFIENQRHSNHRKMEMDVLGQPLIHHTLHLHQQMIYLTLNWYYHTQLCFNIRWGRCRHVAFLSDSRCCAVAFITFLIFTLNISHYFLILLFLSLLALASLNINNCLLVKRIIR